MANVREVPDLQSINYPFSAIGQPRFCVTMMFPLVSWSKASALRGGCTPFYREYKNSCIHFLSIDILCNSKPSHIFIYMPTSPGLSELSKVPSPLTVVNIHCITLTGIYVRIVKARNNLSYYNVSQSYKDDHPTSTTQHCLTSFQFEMSNSLFVSRTLYMSSLG